MCGEYRVFFCFYAFWAGHMCFILWIEILKWQHLLAYPVTSVTILNKSQYSSSQYPSSFKSLSIMRKRFHFKITKSGCKPSMHLFQSVKVQRIVVLPAVWHKLRLPSYKVYWSSHLKVQSYDIKCSKIHAFSMDCPFILSHLYVFKTN